MSEIFDLSCGKVGLDRFWEIDKIDDFCQDENIDLKKHSAIKWRRDMKAQLIFFFAQSRNHHRRMNR